MAGTTYHAPKAWKYQDFIVGYLLCTIVFVPSGTIGVALKWNSPCRDVYADSDIFCRHGLMRLMVMFPDTSLILIIPYGDWWCLQWSYFSMFVLPVQLHFVGEWWVAQISIIYFWCRWMFQFLSRIRCRSCEIWSDSICWLVWLMFPRMFEGTRLQCNFWLG